MTQNGTFTQNMNRQLRWVTGWHRRSAGRAAAAARRRRTGATCWPPPLLRPADYDIADPKPLLGQRLWASDVVEVHALLLVRGAFPRGGALTVL